MATALATQIKVVREKQVPTKKSAGDTSYWGREALDDASLHQYH